MEISKELEFREIESYPGYWVTNTGEVFSENYNRSGLGNFMSAHKNKKGYYTLKLSKKGKVRLFSIHQLVALSFLNNPKNHLEVNHKDGNKSNNNVDNLEWCSRKENNDHAVRHDLYKRKGGIRLNHNKWETYIGFEGKIYYKSFYSKSDAELYLYLKARHFRRSYDI